MGKNKKSYLLFSFFVRIVFIFAFYWRVLFVKDLITLFHRLIWINSSRGGRHMCKFCLRTDASHDTRCSRTLNTQLPSVIAEHAIHHSLVMDGQSFGQSQLNFLLTSKNHTYWLRILLHFLFQTFNQSCFFQVKYYGTSYSEWRLDVRNNVTVIQNC